MREEDGNLISPVKGKPTELDSEIASALIGEGYAVEDSGGGGGSSDWSTATVAIGINNTTTDESLSLPNVIRTFS